MYSVRNEVTERFHQLIADTFTATVGQPIEVVVVIGSEVEQVM